MQVGEGDVGRAAWPANEKTTKCIQWIRSVVLEVHDRYYVVAKIDEDGNPICKNKRGEPQTWRVSYNQFKPANLGERSAPPIPDEIDRTVVTVENVEGNVASLVCSISEPDADVTGNAANADVTGNGLPHGSTPLLPNMASVVLHEPESADLTPERGRNVGKLREIKPVIRFNSCSETAACKRGDRRASRAGLRRFVARSRAQDTDATASRAEASPELRGDCEPTLEELAQGKEETKKDDGQSARIAFAIPQAEARKWCKWTPPKGAPRNRIRALAPAFLVFAVDGVMVRLDWVGSRLFGREMHNEGNAHFTNMLRRRNLRTEMRKRSADDASMIYVTFDRPCKGWVFREAWTADSEHPQKLSQFAPPSEHDAICQMPMFKFE